MAGFGGAVKLTGESEYRKALKQITSDLKEVDSELKLVASQYDKNDKSQEALTAQSEALAKKLDAQAKKVSTLKDAYKQMQEGAQANAEKHKALKAELDNAVSELEKIKKESGETSAEYKLQAGAVASLTTDYDKSSKAIDAQEQALSKARVEINKAQVDYNNTEKTLKGLDKAEEDSAKGSQDLGKSIDEAGKQADKSAKGGFTVLKGALANLASDALKGAIKGITNSVKEIASASVDAVNSVITLGDSIDKNSAKLGISAESYQTWSYVFTRSGADIEGFKSSFLKLSKAIEDGSDAFKELGISSEELESLNKEEIFSKVVAGLQNIQDENKKTVLANQLLGKGAVELGSLLQQSNESTDDLKKRVVELGGVLSDDAVKGAVDMKDSLTDLKTALTGIKNNLVTQFLPSIKDVTDGLTDIATGKDINAGFNKISKGISDTANTILNKILPNVINMIPSLLENGLPVIISGVTSLIKSIGAQLPTIIRELFGAVKTILTDLASWLSEEGNVSEMLSGILELATELVNSFAELLPILLPAVFQVIAEVADFLTKPENIEMLIKSTILIITKIGEALIKSAPVLLKILENIGYNIVDGFVKLGGKLKDGFTTLVNWIKNGVSNWWNNLKLSLSNASLAFLNKVAEVKDKVTNFVSNIFNTIKELPQKVISIGANIASGIWEGLKSKLDYLKKNIKNFGDNIIKSIKNVFKIASPSKVTQELGGYLAEGLGVGFSKEMKEVNRDIDDALPDFSGLKTTGATATGTTGGLDYHTLVSAFKEALTGVDVELDDVKVGKFVTKTVGKAIYGV